KQNLGRCQSRDFDAQVTDTSIVMMNYMALALRKRFDGYETFGGVFEKFKAMMLQKTIIEKIWAVVIQLFGSILAELGIDWEVFIKTLIQKQNVVNRLVENQFEELFSHPMQPNVNIA